MPRRSGGGMRSSSPSRAPPPPPPPRAVAHPPPAAPAPVTAAPQGRQPGLFAQMAATAGGVAIGSAVGHTVGAAITGGFRGGNEQPAAVQNASGPNAQPLYQTPNDHYNADRCNLYQKEFMKCLDQAGGDSSQCQGFWEALKECQRFQGTNATM